MARPPNVIVVLVDQLRAFDVGCYGNAVVQTPHLDGLAARGARFTTAITNNPVCTPARSCLLSGQYSRTCTGALGNDAEDPPVRRRRRLVDPTLAEVFRAAGYATALIGKWHIDVSPLTLGFDHAHYPLTIHRYQGQRYFTGDVLGPPVAGYAPDHESACVADYLAAHRDHPFFLYYNISLPHEPIGPAELPARYVHQYDHAAIPLRRNVFRDGVMAHSDTWFKVYQIWDYFWRLWGPCWPVAPECGYPAAIGELPSDALPPGFDLRHLAALYYGATSWVDDLVGQLLATLTRLQLDENTIVLFAADHGDNLGSHHLFNKDCLYEESLRIPLLIAQPGVIAPGMQATSLATLIDVMPTLLDLCHLPVPPTVQGQSLAPVLRGAADHRPRDAAFIETDPSQFGRSCIGIRTADALYGAFLAADGRTLAEDWGHYDLLADPFQEHNLLGRSAHAAQRDALHARLAQWHAATPWLTLS